MRYGDRNPARYYTEITDEGITLKWILNEISNNRSGVDGQDNIAIYRSTVPGEKGELMAENWLTNFYYNRKPEMYCYTDTTTEPGTTYYYSLWRFYGIEGNDYYDSFRGKEEEKPYYFKGEWQMVAP